VRRHNRARWVSSDVAWRGPRRPYDLAKELLFVGGFVAIVVVALSLAFASPDPPPVSFRQWATASPKDFLSTTLAEVQQTSLSATYGPPYESSAQNGSTQQFGPIAPEKWVGTQIPVHTFNDFVAQPLSTVPGQPAARALATWAAASPAQQQAWSSAYLANLKAAPFRAGRDDVIPTGSGPLSRILSLQLGLARSGGLDAALHVNETSAAIWYSNDQTYPLLYLGDSGQGGTGPDCLGPASYGVNHIDPSQRLPKGYGCWYYNQAVANTAPRYGGYLDGSSWGVVNEVGNWPGAWWLFPYSFWYQWGPGLTSQSADLWAMAMTGLVSLPFLFLPWIPGLRDLPLKTRLYRIFWRDYYDLQERRGRRR